MSTQDKDASTLALSGAVVLVAALGGYLWSQAPLKSSRPANPGLERHEAVVEQRALARLWQDPLAAVDAHLKTQKARGSSAVARGWDDLAHEIASRLVAKTPTPRRMSVLLVMTDGSPYVEGTEQRIRDRYAVGSALSAACYVPDDGDHVGYVIWNRSDPPSSIPFEWYRPRKLRDCDQTGPASTLFDDVLILWLSDELFGDRPLHDLAAIGNQIRRLVDESPLTAGSKPAQRLVFRVVGPPGSAMLRTMVTEAKQDRSGLNWPTTAHDGEGSLIRLYSPWASVSSSVIYQSIEGARAREEVDPHQWVIETLKTSGVDLAYRPPTDFELAQTLLNELHLRRVREGDPIALIAEWDSFYGRNLPLEFSVAACLDDHRDGGRAPCTSHLQGLRLLANPQVQRTTVPWIHHYSYLRGLDGELPGGESGGAPKKAKGKADGGKDGERSLDDLERPEGESQLDYMRRLADRIEEDSEGRRFKAIGILGSDVYDKLLILQALRKRFPHTIFFTTDLDARLLHPSQYDWTHNLIIASHFGLELPPTLQQEIPPFRNNYQSSTFLAVLQALGHVYRSCPACPYEVKGADSASLDIATVPSVYEVGRTTLIPLGTTMSAVNPATVITARSPLPAAAPAADAGWSRSLITSHWLPAAMALFFAFCLAVPVMRSIPEDILSRETAQSALQAGMWLALAAGLTVLGMQWAAAQPNGEPFYWLEGVSIWPSEFIRLFATVLCVAFFFIGHHMLTANQARLTARYGLAPPADLPVSHENAGVLTWLLPSSWGVSFTGSAGRIAALWQEHAGYTRTRWRRILPQTLALGMLGGLLFVIFGMPHTPARGAIAWWANIVVWGLSTATLGLLVFYVVDAIRVCTGFIHQFALEQTQWPPAILAPLCEQRKLPADLIGEWLDLSFIAERTNVVGSLIHYPLIALFLIVAARNRMFDDWSYPAGLLVIFAVTAAYILTCAILLSVAAEKARSSAVKRLRDQIYVLRAKAQEPGQGERCTHQIAQIDQMLRDIDGIRQGAFAHWSEQPVFQALLLPSGGFSALALLDYFLTQ